MEKKILKKGNSKVEIIALRNFFSNDFEQEYFTSVLNFYEFSNIYNKGQYLFRTETKIIRTSKEDALKDGIFEANSNGFY